jgi:hypothetical protein
VGRYKFFIGSAGVDNDRVPGAVLFDTRAKAEQSLTSYIIPDVVRIIFLTAIIRTHTSLASYLQGHKVRATTLRVSLLRVS